MALDAAWATRWMRLTREAVAANREYLIDLDRQIGDGDHGENLDRGFAKVVEMLEDEPAGSVQDVLKVVAKTLMSTVGGAAGPLYGTAFLRAAKAATEEPLSAQGVVAVVAAALEGIQARGKADRGEKTMVDAWAPAMDAAKASVEAGDEALGVLKAAAAAAAEGAAATEALKATKGRASYLGERSIGHLDPGAISSSIILAKAVEAAEES
ncbi:MAG: dihydroxyacetone kinase subunit DhaL [Schaalia hyovaginalis]|uniref:dihydroxyacetone kinase subunit DhaL n=1 Tax=Schaalia hyovaginalis TaxID=29316 RepID=UPI0023F9EB35|nr:dihydroxyacetone kinase subunit DhaL [Schaalia hyovaginalis]MCI7671012.1 dihydroxyacetone kinase subunit L [Schaalia hyovaginalis]MDY5505338.1 dihydroxyacetone kinase subunit DhaL [Schaalia hyovaginalis]MDY6214173.1 dihydroxyacetone kinase subunit DhaL [Schaalia hyovaginalis]